ncbi:MAG: acetyl-CoA carboxylase biotin carboxyl carrier protein [Phycisphaerae bacterium]|nr:acetyl-CoA carboxylase biotin carboxyl carrier protein [Phycisphaerae bacterium]
MVEHDLSEIRIREGESMITLRKGPTGEPMMMTAAPSMVMSQPPATVLPAPAAPPPAVDEGLVPIRSPMVGTFYAASDPESPPFVAIGSEVDVTTTVCVIEAMKVFNEIHAEVAGTIERILVNNEQAVEYGQPLMLVRPKA